VLSKGKLQGKIEYLGRVKIENLKEDVKELSD
jgi:hypothetical protein